MTDLSLKICLVFLKVNDTIASLTSQEVTEMEVQVDPMIFLEDDQSEDGTQEIQVNAG